MVYKALLWTNVFWISYIKWYKFYNNNLSVVLGSKQGVDVETCEPQTRGLSVNSIADSLSLNVLWRDVKLFSNENKQMKVRKFIKCVTEFSHKYDLSNGKYLSIFLGFFAGGKGQLHEIKRSRDKTEIGKELIKKRVNKYILKLLAYEIVWRHEKKKFI